MGKSYYFAYYSNLLRIEIKRCAVYNFIGCWLWAQTVSMHTVISTDGNADDCDFDDDEGRWIDNNHTLPQQRQQQQQQQQKQQCCNIAYTYRDAFAVCSSLT
jgi:hypothetical protein